MAVKDPPMMEEAQILFPLRPHDPLSALSKFFALQKKAMVQTASKAALTKTSRLKKKKKEKKKVRTFVYPRLRTR